jgi:hypothetical protein
MSEHGRRPDTSEGSRSQGQGSLFFPVPDRHVPGERWLRTVLRTLHIASMAVLLGGHVFEVPADQLYTALACTLISGGLIVLLEIYGSLNWLFEVRGLVTVVKVGLVCAVALFWEQRVWLLMAALALGSLSSHATAEVRHYSLRTGRIGKRKSG